MSNFKPSLIILLLIYSGSALAQKLPPKAGDSTYQKVSGDSISKLAGTGYDPYGAIEVEVDPTLTFKIDLDSLKETTDSLIDLRRYLAIEIYPEDCKEVIKPKGKFYIDTIKRHIIKIELDTSFVDHYGISYSRIEMYYYEGRLVSDCWLSKEFNSCITSKEGQISTEDFYRLKPKWNISNYPYLFRLSVVNNIKERIFFQKKYERYLRAEPK